MFLMYFFCDFEHHERSDIMFLHIQEMAGISTTDIPEKTLQNSLDG